MMSTLAKDFAESRTLLKSIRCLPVYSFVYHSRFTREQPNDCESCSADSMIFHCFLQGRLQNLFFLNLLRNDCDYGWFSG